MATLEQVKETLAQAGCVHLGVRPGQIANGIVIDVLEPDTPVWTDTHGTRLVDTDVPPFHKVADAIRSAFPQAIPFPDSGFIFIGGIDA